MASGDSVNALESKALDATLDIRPPSGTEWIIHNIIIPDGLVTGVELYYVTGSDTILVGTFKSSLLCMSFHPTYTYYYQLKNKETAAQLIGYDGITVK